MGYLETARKMMGDPAHRKADVVAELRQDPPPAPIPPPDPGRAPEWRRQLLWWPAALWKEWEAATCDLWQGGMDNAEAGHVAFERLKGRAPRGRLILPPTVPSPGCGCPFCAEALTLDRRNAA